MFWVWYADTPNAAFALFPMQYMALFMRITSPTSCTSLPSGAVPSVVFLKKKSILSSSNGIPS